MGNHLEIGTQIWIIFSVQCICACFQLLQSCLTLCDPIDYSPPGSSSMGFSGQEHWSRLPCPHPGDLPDSGTEPRSPALQADTLLLSHGGSTKRRELAFRLFLILHLEYLFFSVVFSFKRVEQFLQNSQGKILLLEIYKQLVGTILIEIRSLYLRNEKTVTMSHA